MQIVSHENKGRRPRSGAGVEWTATLVEAVLSYDRAVGRTLVRAAFRAVIYRA